MSFDKTNAADVAALKAELDIDPLAMGYATFIDQSHPTLNLLNNPAENLGGENINRPTEELDIPGIAAVIDPTEYGALTAYDKAWVQMFITREAGVALAPYQAKFLAIFNNVSVTRIAVLALRVKLASRSEILFGVNTVLDEYDLAAARV